MTRLLAYRYGFIGQCNVYRDQFILTIVEGGRCKFLVFVLATPQAGRYTEILEARSGIRFGAKAGVVMQGREHHLQLGAVVDILLSVAIAEAAEGAARAQWTPPRSDAVGHGELNRFLCRGTQRNARPFQKDRQTDRHIYTLIWCVKLAH
jgi:hypothetical protein